MNQCTSKVFNFNIFSIVLRTCHIFHGLWPHQTKYQKTMETDCWGHVVELREKYFWYLETKSTENYGKFVFVLWNSHIPIGFYSSIVKAAKFSICFQTKFSYHLNGTEGISCYFTPAFSRPSHYLPLSLSISKCLSAQSDHCFYGWQQNICLFIWIGGKVNLHDSSACREILNFFFINA